MFRDRRDAGRRLAGELAGYKARDPVVLALPRGGVPVGFEVAQRLDVPLHVLVVRKLGAPGNPEVAMGAIGMGVRVVNDRIVAAMDLTQADLDEAARREERELVRRQDRYAIGAPPDIQGRSVILVDDGIATGATIQAAVRLIRQRGAHDVVLAVPVLPPRAATFLSQEVDDLHYLAAPDDFMAVGQFYDDFQQTDDAEVLQLLRLSRGEDDIEPATRPRQVEADTT